MLSKICIYIIHKEKNVFGNVFQIDILVFRSMKLTVWYMCFLFFIFLKKLPPIQFWFDYTSEEDNTHNDPTSHTTQHPPLFLLPLFHISTSLFTSLFAIPNQYLQYPFANLALRVNPIIFFLNSLGVEAQRKQ